MSLRRKLAGFGAGSAIVATGMYAALKYAPRPESPEVDMDAVEYAILNDEPLEQSSSDSWDIELGGVTLASLSARRTVSYDPSEQAE